MSASTHPEERAPGDGFLILWVSGPEPWEQDLQRRLADEGVTVDVSRIDGLVARANARAPDLVLLSGAAGSAPHEIVGALQRMHPACTAPVAALGPPEDARTKPDRHYGLVARLDRTLGAETLSRQLRTLLRSLSRRPARWRIGGSVRDLERSAEGLHAAGRTGLLALPGAGALAITREGIRPSPHRFRTGVAQAADIMFYERPSSTMRICDTEPREDETAPPIQGARILIIDPDLGRAESLATRLERAGAQARACPVRAAHIASARALDPTLVVVQDESLLTAECVPLWTEARLACAGMLIVDADILVGAQKTILNGPIAEMCQLELSIQHRLHKGEALADRLETLGTPRWLKILGRCPGEVTLRVYAATGRGRVDLRNGKVRGATFRPADSRTGVIEGRAAVDELLRLPFGRVLAGRADAIVALEGAHASRKQSVVGQVRAKRGGQSGPHGVATEQLINEPVQDPATDIPRSVPPRPVSRRPSQAPPRPRLATPQDELEALRQELSRSVGVTSRPPPPQSARPPAKSPPAASSRPPPPPLTAPRSTSGRELEVAPAPPANSASVSAGPPSPSAPPAVVTTLESVETEPADTPAPRTWLVLSIVTALMLLVGGVAAWHFAHRTPSSWLPSSARPTAPEEATEPTRSEAPSPADAPGPAGENRETAPPASGSPEEVDSMGSGEAVAPHDPNGEPPEGGPDTDVDDLLDRSAQAARDGDLATSAELASLALRAAPGHSGAAYRLAVALFRQGHYEEALAWADHAARWDPTSALPVSLQGDILTRRGRFTEAALRYQRALELEPHFRPAQRQLERLRARDRLR